MGDCFQKNGSEPLIWTNEVSESLCSTICSVSTKFATFPLLWWFSVGIFKYKPGYKPHDLLQFECSHWLKLQHSDWRSNHVKDFFKINFPPMRALEL